MFAARGTALALPDSALTAKLSKRASDTATSLYGMDSTPAPVNPVMPLSDRLAMVTPLICSTIWLPLRVTLRWLDAVPTWMAGDDVDAMSSVKTPGASFMDAPGVFCRIQYA